jgi:MarR family transcriptional regulator, temperature-dependent positive regulator of motility
MKTHGMAGHLIRRLHQLSTQVFAKRMQDIRFDLTSVQFAALEAIVTHPGIDQAGVAALIGYDRATIGGVIDRLEQKGFVERNVSVRDRRAREVRATEAGVRTFEAILPIVSALQDDILARLSASERSILMMLVSKAVAGDGFDLATPPAPAESSSGRRGVGQSRGG